MRRLRGAFLLSMALCLPQVEAAEPARVDAAGVEASRMRDRLDRLEAQLQNQGLLGLLARLEENKSDIARLRGALEEFSHQLKLVEQRQKDYYQDLDQRLKALDARQGTLAAQLAKPAEGLNLQPAGTIKPPAQAVIAPVASEAAPAQTPAGGEGMAFYEKGSTLFKRGKYSEAVTAFEQYVKDYPDSDLAANALYWLGLSYLAMEDFKQAAEAQQRLIKNFPKHDKRADAMLSLARVQARLKQNVLARETLDQLIAQYPKSKAAGTGRKLRAILD